MACATFYLAFKVRYHMQWLNCRHSVFSAKFSYSQELVHISACTHAVCDEPDMHQLPKNRVNVFLFLIAFRAWSNCHNLLFPSCFARLPWLE